MTCWKDLLNETLRPQTVEDLVVTTLTPEQMEAVFDNDFGGPEGCPFTAWTTDRVFFPICYDGLESVGSAPRNPTTEALARPLDHQGSW